MTHRIIRRVALAASAFLPALAFGLTSSTAEAHGGIPRAFGIMFEPDKPDDMMFRSDVWGIFRSKDNGKTWLWGCAELYQSNSLNADHRNMLIAPGGRILVAGGFNGLLVSDDLCSWHPSKSFSHTAPDGGMVTELVQDVLQRDTDFYALTATGVNGKINGHLWKSSDKGETWTMTGGAFPTDFAGTELGIPPSGSTTRIYASGRHIDADGVVAASDDNGKTWKITTVPTKLDTASIRISLIHPTNPDIFFVWADQAEGFGQDSTDEIWGTTDGGKSFSLVYTSTGDLPGIALSPDNTELLVAGPLESIVAAKLDDALSMGQKAFTPRLTGCPDSKPCQVWGLAWNSAGLYAGMNDFVTGGLTKATLGVSHDSGKTFEKIMDLCDVKFDSACASNTTMAQACTSVWNTGYAYDYINGPRCMTCTIDPDTGTCPATGGAGGASPGGSSGSGAGTGGGSNPNGGTAGSSTASGASPGTAGASGTTTSSGGQTNGGTAGASSGGNGNVKVEGGCGCSTAPRRGHYELGLLALALGALGRRGSRRRTS